MSIQVSKETAIRDAAQVQIVEKIELDAVKLLNLCADQGWGIRYIPFVLERARFVSVAACSDLKKR